jgi:hypothetical protein
MKHPWIAAVAGLLLPLPLILALGAGRGLPGAQDTAQETVSVSPVLTADERRAFLTHERLCRTARDCDAPLGCVPLPDGQSLCMASDCQTDVQCAEGFTCKALRSRGEGPRVRRCIVKGLVEEGAPCVPSFTFKHEVVCRPELRCNGYCGRPCQLGEPASCPEGSFCMDGNEGPSCMPTCEGKSCAEGQQCVRFERRYSVCASIRGENCQSQPCPEGMRCSVSTLPRSPGEIQMECVRACGEGQPPCPEGTVCEQGDCRRPCAPNDAHACAPHESCNRHLRSNRYLCSPR